VKSKVEKDSPEAPRHQARNFSSLPVEQQTYPLNEVSAKQKANPLQQ
jgi:hypothetical protein